MQTTQLPPAVDALIGKGFSTGPNPERETLTMARLRTLKNAGLRLTALGLLVLILVTPVMAQDEEAANPAAEKFARIQASSDSLGFGSSAADSLSEIPVVIEPVGGLMGYVDRSPIGDTGAGSLFVKGGFNESGPVDDRGLVMVLLGKPDEIQRKAMPMNFRDQDDAQIKVFKRFAPDREGVSSKGTNLSGELSINPYDASGGIPMPYSERALSQIESRANSATHSFGFELWKYDQNGSPLYENQFSRNSMGARFLFLDRTGSGDFYLESSNLIQGEE